jgi:hypothetical protein
MLAGAGLKSQAGTKKTLAGSSRSLESDQSLF